MSGIEHLEQRVAYLEKELARLGDREEIKELRYKYWRCMRDRLSDEIMECFDEKAELDFGPNRVLKGHKAIEGFYRDLFESEERPRQIPQGHNPEIRITSDTAAEAVWLLDVLSAMPGAATGTRIGVQYDETYVKGEHGWRIKRMKNHYLYHQPVKLEEER